MPKKSSKLQKAHEIIDLYHFDVEDLDITALKDFRDFTSELKDNRHPSYIQHRLGDIVVITILAVLAHADEWSAIADFAVAKEQWLKKFLILENGIPSHDTIQAVISMLDSDQLFGLCMEFLLTKVNAYETISRQQDTFNQKEVPIIAIDGKTSRGSSRNDTGNGSTKPLHTLNAFSSDYGMCIGQKFVDEKTNEIPMTKELLDLLDINGSIVTWDALNTQKENVAKVIEKKGDYVIALKANHNSLYEEVKDYFNDETLLTNNPFVAKHKNVEKEHNGIVKRETVLTTEVDWIYDKKSWKGLKGIAMVKKTITPLKGEQRIEKRYYLASITDVALITRSIREHWSVENKLHWQLDVTFKDDANTTKERKGAQNLQIMKKIALALIKLSKPAFGNKSMNRIRNLIGWNFEENIEKVFTILNVEKVEADLRAAGKIK